MFSAQVLVNGVAASAVLALLAVAFQTVYLTTGVFFLGLSGIYVACPFVVLSCRRHGCGWCLSILAGIIVSLLLAEICELINHHRLAAKNAPAETHLITSLGTYLVILQVVLMIWGADTNVFPSDSLPSTNSLAGVTFTQSQLIECGTGAAVLALWFIGLLRTKIGLQLRALSDNPEQFVLMGMNQRRFRLFAFGAAGVIAAISSVVSGYDIGFDPHDGLHRVLLAVVAIVVGGRSTFMGPVLGSLILCLVREQVAWNFSARWQETATFFVLAIFVLFRPQGILGKRRRLEYARGVSA